jgi:hypothetical protein
MFGQLATQGVPVRRDCALSRASAQLREFRGLVETHAPKRFDSIDKMIEFNSAADGADFLSKMLHRGCLAGLSLEKARWQDLVGGNPVPTMSATSSRRRNTAWETVLASAMATFCRNVRFAEPDVIGEFEGQEFGVAAKVAYSAKELWANVDKGASQANGRSKAALIFVNVVNLLDSAPAGPVPTPRVEAFQASRRHRSIEETRRWMDDWICRWYERPEVVAMARKLHETALCPMGVAFFMPFIVQAEGQPLPAFYTHMPITWGEDDDSPDYRFARAFLQSCNSVLGFQAP